MKIFKLLELMSILLLFLAGCATNSETESYYSCSGQLVVARQTVVTMQFEIRAHNPNEAELILKALFPEVLGAECEGSK